MHFSTLLPALAATAFAHRSSNSHAHLHKERQQVDQASVFVSGAAGLGDNQIHARLEISEFMKRSDQWSLYIQALANWQNTSTTDATGYYQVAGIHGVPRVDFDSVGQCSDCSAAWGYCTHASVLFPAWHRTYVSLWEQLLIQNAQNIASQYPAGSKRDAMMAAAATIRQPFWDWAAKPASGNVFPDIFVQATVTVDGPNGPLTLENPLYKYEIPEAEVQAMYFSPYINWDETMRYPNTNDPSAQSQESQVVSAFNNIQGSLQQQVYGLLTNCPDYLSMSNQASGSAQGSTCSNDIEGIHNTVHTTTGGPGSPGIAGGHMSSLPVASFDAVFMIHHANVDRIFALWQSANPNSYGGSQTAVQTTWTIATGSTQDSDSDLTPFRKDANSFWTTNQVKDFQNTFKYTYPEFLLSDGSQSSISKFVGMLYGSSPSLSASSLSSQVELNNQTNSKSKTVASTSSSASAGPSSYASVTSAVASAATTTSASQANKSPAATSGSSAGGLGGLLGGLTSATGSGLDGLVNEGNSIASDVAGALGGLPTAAAGVGSDVAGGLSAGIGGLATGLGGVASHVVSDVGSLASDVPNAVGGLVNGVGSLTGDLAGVLLNVTESILPSFLAPNGSQYHYNCHVANDISSINGSYFVYVFDGEPSTNSSDNYLFASNLIGIMAAPATGMFMEGHIQTGAIPLTSYLQSQVRLNLLPGMSEEHTIPYLTANLVWKLVVAGNEVDLNVHVGFQAAVYSSTSTPGNGTTAPSWSEPIPQVQVSQGKPGGAISAPQGAQVLPLPLPQSSSTCSESTSTPAPTSTSCSTESASTAAPVYISTSVADAVTNSAPAYTSPVAPAYTPAASSSVVSPVWTSAAPAWNGTAKATGWRPTGTASATVWAQATSTVSPYRGAADKASFSLAGVVALVAVAAAL